MLTSRVWLRMKILTVQHAIPTRMITTDWIVEKLRRRNEARLSERELRIMDQQVRGFLEGAGSDVKYQVNDGEKAIDFMLAATKAALEATKTAPHEIEFIIYCGVGRGWLEPGTGHVLQAQLQLTKATCFDVLDGCAGWLRALQIAHTYIRSGAYRCGLIVNCECGFADFGRWQFSGVEDLKHYLGTFTIGEAATATIVSDEEAEDDFYFTFKSFGEHVKLCMIPLENASQFLPEGPARAYSPTKFFVESGELLSTTTKKIIETFESDCILQQGRYDICFGHAASEKASEIIRKKLRIARDTYYPTHARYGNTVSASIPLGLSLALQEGRLKRGDRVLIIVGASGITVGFGSFTY